MLMHRHPGVNPAVVFRGVGGHHTNRTPPMPSSLPRSKPQDNPPNLLIPLHSVYCLGVVNLD